MVAFVLGHAQVHTDVCSLQCWEHGYTLVPRTVPDYNLIFVTRGKVIWEVEGEPLTLAPGSLAVVPPDVEHRAYSLTQRITLLSLHITMHLPGRQDALALLTPPPSQQVEAGSPLDRYLREAVREFERPEARDVRMMLACWSRLVALELLRDNAARGLLDYHPVDPLVSEVMDRLNTHMAEPTRLNDLARWAGFSPQHLNRLFRRQIGVTPLQYLARLRMDLAATLLTEGRLTVRAIAAKVGFDDPYYFSRTFKDHFGRSPDHYRQGADLAAGSDSPS